MDGWMEGRMDGLLDGWIDVWMDGIYPCSGPLGTCESPASPIMSF